MLSADATPPLPPRDLRWDVLEEHLDEAAYGVELWLRTLESPELDLDALARYPEERLIANVDALVVGGAPVRARLLVPALEAADPEQPALLVAACWALMEAGAFADLAPVLEHPEPGVRSAAALAAKSAIHAELDGWIQAELARESASARLLGLLELGAARSLRPPSLLGWLQSDDPALLEAAARAAQFADPTTHQPLLQHLVDHELPPVRDAALLMSLAWGSQHAWNRCQRWALDPAQPSTLATQLYSVLGGREAHAALVELLATAGPKRAALLFALGFSGNVALRDVLMQCLGGAPLEARLAAQGLGLTFGFLPADDAFALSVTPASTRGELPPADQDPEALASLPALEDDDLDADLVPQPEESLPPPNAEAIGALCADRARQLPSTTRVLFGAAYDAAQLAHVLAFAPLRWRNTLALGLMARSGGALCLDTRAPTKRQRQQLGAVRSARLFRYQEL